MPRLSFALAFALATLLARPARADSAVVLTSLSDASAQERALAAQTAREELARHDYAVADARTSEALETWIEQTNCEQCERDALRAHGVDVALVVMLWMPSDVRTEGQATVEMLDRDGLTVYGEAAFTTRAEIPAAVQRAVAEAVRLFPHRAGVPFSVRGLPDDAVVLVDDQPVGTLPFSGHLQAGHHTVSVFHQGFRSEERSFDLSLGDAPVAWSVDLTPEGEDTSRAGAPRKLWWLGPTALGAVAVGLGVGVAVAASRAEDRGDFEPVDGYQRRALDVAPTAALGAVAGAALVGSITWAVVGAKPHRRASTELSFGPGHIQLSAHF
jgi:hypothetical protein